MKTYTLEEVEDKLIGKIGTPERDNYELKIKLFQFGQMIKSVRKSHKLTQTELGELIGVERVKISKLENGKSEMALRTIFKIFEALKSQLHFEVQSNDKNLVPA